MKPYGFEHMGLHAWFWGLPWNGRGIEKNDESSHGLSEEKPDPMRNRWFGAFFWNLIANAWIALPHET